MFFDPIYFLVLAPAMIVSAAAAFATRARFARFSQVPNARRVSGAQVARHILDHNGLHDVTLEAAPGDLTDHYDPRTRVVRLSENVYYGGSVASLAIAAHETGHAIQHAKKYLPLALRNMSIPFATVGSQLSWILLVAGFLLSAASLIWTGVILFTGTVVFQLATLPVELDASRRARYELSRLSLMSPTETTGVSKVLNAAAMTYVGAALTGLLTLFYFLLRLGVFSPRRD